MFHVYILFSRSLSKYYIGHTANLHDRIQRHNEGRSKYTKSGTPWQLVYSESFNSRGEAQTREYEIKSWKSKSKIEELIVKGASR